MSPGRGCKAPDPRDGWPPIEAAGQLELLSEELADLAVANQARRGPKGARAGDVVRAEGTRWRVCGLDGDQAICRLLAGSHALRRFRARAIERVEAASSTRRPRTRRGA